MAVFLGVALGGCALVATWGLGLDPKVGGLIALAFTGIGFFVQKAFPPDSGGFQR